MHLKAIVSGLLSTIRFTIRQLSQSAPGQAFHQTSAVKSGRSCHQQPDAGDQDVQGHSKRGRQMFNGRAHRGECKDHVLV